MTNENRAVFIPRFIGWDKVFDYSDCFPEVRVRKSGTVILAVEKCTLMCDIVNTGYTIEQIKLASTTPTMTKYDSIFLRAGTPIHDLQLDLVRCIADFRLYKTGTVVYNMGIMGMGTLTAFLKSKNV